MFCSRHDLYIEKNNGGFKGLERNNTSIAASPTGRVVILVMMYVDTFKTAIPAFHRKSHNMLDVILIVTVTQSVTNVSQTNNTSTSGMNE
jgi:fumarate reductase subunit D